jgi:hypothetical protein
MTVFTDKMDVSTKISLYEYGIIRDPKTNKCVVCTNIHELDVNFGDLSGDSIKPKVKIFWIDFDDVVETLEEISDGYFDFIGSTRLKELRLLDESHLVYHIYSIEMYDGRFNLY